MVRSALLITSALMLLSACSQSQHAELVDKSNSFYGRNGWMENGQPVPRFSADRPATQAPTVAYKYQEQQYGVDAAVETVKAQELPPPPTAMKAQPAPVAIAAAPTPMPAVTAPVAPKPLAQAPTPHSVGTTAMFRWPVEGNVISRFGPKTNGFSNDGINIAATEGDPIWAAADGKVAYVGQDLDGYGNLLIIRHANGWMSSYAHAKEFLLKQEDIVAKGDLLGYVGTTGSVRTPQLHFSVREGKIPVDPESVLAKQVANVNQ